MIKVYAQKNINQTLKDIIVRAFSWPPEDLASSPKRRGYAVIVLVGSGPAMGEKNFDLGSV